MSIPVSIFYMKLLLCSPSLQFFSMSKRDLEVKMACQDVLDKRGLKVREDILGREVCLETLKRVHLALLVLLV